MQMTIVQMTSPFHLDAEETAQRVHKGNRDLVLPIHDTAEEKMTLNLETA